MDQLYSPKKVARIFDMNYRKILDLITLGELSAYKIGGSYRIAESEIHRYLESVNADSYWHNKNLN